MRPSIKLGGLNFYPRPPRGGRPSIPEAGADLVVISIHALRVVGVNYFIGFSVLLFPFLSTPSARRATLALCDVYEMIQ